MLVVYFCATQLTQFLQILAQCEILRSLLQLKTNGIFISGGKSNKQETYAKSLICSLFNLITVCEKKSNHFPFPWVSL